MTKSSAPARETCRAALGPILQSHGALALVDGHRAGSCWASFGRHLKRTPRCPDGYGAWPTTYGIAPPVPSFPGGTWRSGTSAGALGSGRFRVGVFVGMAGGHPVLHLGRLGCTGNRGAGFWLAQGAEDGRRTAVRKSDPDRHCPATSSSCRPIHHLNTGFELGALHRSYLPTCCAGSLHAASSARGIRRSSTCYSGYAGFRVDD